MVGLQIRLARLRRGWTAQELATRAGISRATVLSIESGTGNVALNGILEACWLLGVELAGSLDPRMIEKRIALLQADLAAGAKRARKPRTREPNDDF